MNRLRTKTSRFFTNSPTQNEKVAIMPTEQEVDFDAGIERGLKKKPSRFFRKQNDKALPNLPYIDPSEGSPPPLLGDFERSERTDVTVKDTAETASNETHKPLPSRTASCMSVSSGSKVTPDGESHDAARKTKQADQSLKKRSSFASLRKSSSRIFRSNAGDHDAPPPPMPQIPIDTPTPKLPRLLLRPAESKRSSRSSQSSKVRVTSISRPMPCVQAQRSDDIDPMYKHPYAMSNGPPPPRPERPGTGSVDEGLVAMQRDSVTRTNVHTPNRARARTLTASTASSAWSPALSRVGSEEAYSRLGLPSGHSSLSSPRSPVFDSPLAANFPMDPNMPLPFRDSDGSVLGYSRFSAYVKARQGYGSGGYEDGVEDGDRDLGPVEMYCVEKCADWMLEKRVSGKLGERGMLFRDRWGGWHLVRDI